MAQRYVDPTARQRMSGGLCPECGKKPAEHSSSLNFWDHFGGCDLLPRGVEDRIAQYRADIDEPRRSGWICPTCNVEDGHRHGCPDADEPRRNEPDWALIDDEPELNQWANRMGMVFEPGRWPTTDGGI